MDIWATLAYPNIEETFLGNSPMPHPPKPTPEIAKAQFLAPMRVCRILDVGASTVERWVREGTLPHIRTPGGHVRIPVQAIEAIVAGEGASSK